MIAIVTDLETRMTSDPNTARYIHGTSPDEQSRLSALNRLTNRSFVEFLEVEAGMRVLEVGSGLGILAVDVATTAKGASIVGVERSQNQIDAAHRAPNVNYVNGDAQQLEFSDASFDLTYSRYLLEHLLEPACALREMRRVTRRNGRVVSCENDISIVRLDPPCPSFNKVWSAFQTYQRSLGGNPRIGTSLYRLFREAGFREVVLSVQPEVHRHGSSDFEAWIGNLIDNIRGVQIELVETGLCNKESISLAIRELETLMGNSDASSWFVWNRAVAVC